MTFSWTKSKLLIRKSQSNEKNIKCLIENQGNLQLFIDYDYLHTYCKISDITMLSNMCES